MPGINDLDGNKSRLISRTSGRIKHVEFLFGYSTVKFYGDETKRWRRKNEPIQLATKVSSHVNLKKLFH